VAWASQGQDGDGSAIIGRRFSADGSPLGSEFQANTIISGDQMAPAVAVSGSGDFMVVWEGPSQSGQQYGVWGRRYDSNGVPVGP
jgi:hypothetical protein